MTRRGGTPNRGAAFVAVIAILVLISLAVVGRFTLRFFGIDSRWA